MNPESKDIRQLLDQRLRQTELDLIEIVPVPTHGDRMVRLRTLEEALEDFASDQGAVSYLIQVRARPAAAAAAQTAAAQTAAAQTAAAIATPAAPRTEPELLARAYQWAPIQTPDTALTLPPTSPAIKTAAATAAAAAGTTSAPPTAPHRPSAATASPVTGDNIYHADGQLNIPYLVRNAELLMAARDYASARNIFRAIAASGERTGLALFGMGRCDEYEGRLDPARAHYEESIAYHPTLESYHRLSCVLAEQKKDAVAAEALERALNLKEVQASDPRTRFELHKACGNHFTRARQAEAAERHFGLALELDPAADDIRANLGALHLQSQKIDEARRVFEDALASNPRNSRAIAGLASCHLARGETRQAHDGFARALEIEPTHSVAVFHLVKCAYELRSYATAARVVEDYVQIAPVNASLLYSLAGLQFHLGRLQDAGATARKILGLNPEHSGARELLKLIERSV